MESVKGCGPASVFREAADTKVLGSPDYMARGNISMRVCFMFMDISMPW